MDELGEVVTAAPKRPSFTSEFWQSIIDMMLKPGACVAQIARQHRLNDDMLFKWRRRYLEAQARAAASVPALTGSLRSTDDASMLPMSISVSAKFPARGIRS
ncbi:transposase [Paraburkholderia caffeinilytica]|uniref:transposase n=1 Tax=Paraburkholderia caffeinilytica TaxID=1761016 RepID=UPI003DA19632